MTEEFKVNLFLTNSEREDCFELIDFLAEQDVDTMEEWERNNRWGKLIARLVLGKCHYKTKQQFFPVCLTREKQ